MADEKQQSGGDSGGGGYTVDPGAPYREVTIGDKTLTREGNPVSLTKAELETLQSQGIRVTEATKK